MKKILLSILIFGFSLFCITACGEIKKDSKIVEEIIDRINKDIDDTIPKDEVKITPAILNVFYLREIQLAKNIKVEVTDVISNEKYQELYIKEKVKETPYFYRTHNISIYQEMEKRKENPNIVYYKYIITADIVNLNQILKEKTFTSVSDREEFLMDILSKKNEPNLKYETVEGFGYCWYNTKTGEWDYTDNGFGFSKEFPKDNLNIAPFLYARGHQL